MSEAADRRAFWGWAAGWTAMFIIVLALIGLAYVSTTQDRANRLELSKVCISEGYQGYNDDDGCYR